MEGLTRAQMGSSRDSYHLTCIAGAAHVAQTISLALHKQLIGSSCDTGHLTCIKEAAHVNGITRLWLWMEVHVETVDCCRQWGEPDAALQLLTVPGGQYQHLSKRTKAAGVTRQIATKEQESLKMPWGVESG
eukprot:1155333-Pelagomonas_calceolata.AAC.5